MVVRPSLIAIALALLAAGCSDTFGPGPAPEQPAVTLAPRFLLWAGDSAPRFSAIGAHPGDGALRGAGDEISLHQNTVTFWAVRGQERSVQINYQSGTDGTQPFLRLTTSDPTYVPGLGDLAPGDSVAITVTVDPKTLSVSFGPTGLRFGTPSPLRIWYGGAGGDLNGDGVVDDSDAEIERRLLAVVYREGPADPWIAISTMQSLADKSFLSGLQHFSEYAISW